MDVQGAQIAAIVSFIGMFGLIISEQVERHIVTLSAALLTRALRRFTVFGLPLPASLPPVLLNAVVVGGELTWAEANTLHTPLLWINMAQVGLGQLVACTVLGVLLVWTLKKAGLDVRLFGREQAE